jgi:hypothetical protein
VTNSSQPDSTAAGHNLETVREEVEVMGDPRSYPALGAFWPWSKAGREAEELRRQAELDLFRCTLETVRQARQTLDQAAGLRVVEAAEAFVFEVRAQGERRRFQLLTDAHREMTVLFLEQLRWIEEQRGACSAEMLDALKERALSELTAAMNRLSKSDVEFDRKPFLGVKR